MMFSLYEKFIPDSFSYETRRALESRMVGVCFRAEHKFDINIYIKCFKNDNRMKHMSICVQMNDLSKEKIAVIQAFVEGAMS